MEPGPDPRRDTTDPPDDGQDGAAPGRRPPPGGDGAVERLLDGMERVAAARAELDVTELSLINAARRQGLPWWAIARALGVRTAQGACQRAHRLAERLDDAMEEGRSVAARAHPGRSRGVTSAGSGSGRDPVVWSRAPSL